VGVKAAIPLFSAIIGLIVVISSERVSGPAAEAFEIDTLIAKMQAAYAGIADYRMQVDMKTRVDGDSFKTAKFLYTFKKPHRIRLDFESPYQGTILVYPDKQGKVLVRPWGRSGLLEFHLEPDGFLLRGLWGQRIDQTHMGLLIKNIFRSVKEGRKGPLQLKETQGHVQVQVLSENHFLRTRLTQYEFIIDKSLWLPVAIKESSPEGVLERSIDFLNLRVNVGITDGLFDLEGE
jgi:outer membrane lipoprotein-sorting protein